jgi:hypothetical protein
MQEGEKRIQKAVSPKSTKKVTFNVPLERAHPAVGGEEQSKQAPQGGDCGGGGGSKYSSNVNGGGSGEIPGENRRYPGTEQENEAGGKGQQPSFQRLATSSSDSDDEGLAQLMVPMAVHNVSGFDHRKYSTRDIVITFPRVA